MFLDNKLNLKNIFQKTNKTIGLLRNLQTLLLRAPLITIYKSFIRPHLDYGDMIYDQTFNVLFQKKMETKYSTALARTGTVRGSSKEKLYQQLGSSTATLVQKTLYSIIPIHNMSYRIRQGNKIPAINVKHNFFKNTFFLSTIIKWNKLDQKIKNSKSIQTLKKRILSFVSPSTNNTFNCHNSRPLKLLSRLWLGLSHLREHKFKHSFQDFINPFCSCRKDEVEISFHYLLHCSNYLEERLALLDTIKNTDMSIKQESDSKFTSALLFGDTSFDKSKNTFILDATIDYIILTGRFDIPLFGIS